jgi:hypothetical protein
VFSGAFNDRPRPGAGRLRGRAELPAAAKTTTDPKCSESLSGGTMADAARVADWWKQFDDKELGSLVDQAVKASTRSMLNESGSVFRDLLAMCAVRRGSMPVEE